MRKILQVTKWQVWEVLCQNFVGSGGFKYNLV